MVGSQEDWGRVFHLFVSNKALIPSPRKTLNPPIVTVAPYNFDVHGLAPMFNSGSPVRSRPDNPSNFAIFGLSSDFCGECEGGTFPTMLIAPKPTR